MSFCRGLVEEPPPPPPVWSWWGGRWWVWVEREEEEDPYKGGSLGGWEPWDPMGEEEGEGEEMEVEEEFQSNGHLSYLSYLN